jgi:hypothetical protein
MPISRIVPGTPPFDLFADALRRELGKEPEDYDATAVSDDTFVLGQFEGERLAAFAIFRSFLDPTLHLGGMIDPAYFKGLEELGDVSIFNISMIRTIGGTENLGRAAGELIVEAERLLLGRSEAYCMLISLFKEANRKAFRLYRSLGFKKRGGESYYMDVDPADVLKKYGRAGRAEGDIRLKTFDEMDEKDRESLAQCYGQVFVSNLDLPVLQHLGRIISKKAFLPRLSTLVCDASRGGEVVGFCFIEKESDESVYINAAGLRRDFRGGAVSMRSFSWIMENCMKEGYRKATLVTASKKLKAVFSEMICARSRDTLVWFIKCGMRDG